MEWDDGGIREAISGMGEPERSVMMALLERVRGLEAEVGELRGGAADPGGLAGRVESLEEAVEGVGRGGLEETVERVDRLEEEAGEMRDEIRDLQGQVEEARG